MRRYLLVLSVGLLTQFCDTTQKYQPVAESDQSQSVADISAALDASGNCLKRNEDWWAYVVKFREGGQAWVIKHASSPREFEIQLHDERGNMQLGSVDFDQQSVDWFDPREHKGEGRATPHGRIEYPPPTAEETRREWFTPRGQQLVSLVRKAEVSCGNTG